MGKQCVSEESSCDLVAGGTQGVREQKSMCYGTSQRMVPESTRIYKNYLELKCPSSDQDAQVSHRKDTC